MIKSSQTGYYFRKISNRALKEKQAKQFDDVFYQKYDNITFGDTTFGKFFKNSKTLGCCHFYAMLLSKFTPFSVLKVGELKNLEASVRDEYVEPFEHSWVEVGDFVFDTTSKQIYNKDYYYQVFKPQVYKEYLQSDLNDEKTFLLHMFWSLKNRELLLEDNFNKLFKNKYYKYINDDEFVKKIKTIKNKYYISINLFNNEEIIK